MNWLLLVFATVAITEHALGLPVVTQKTPKPEEKDPAADSKIENLENIIEYDRYLKEVVSALESDQEFREKLDKAQESDIRTGKIAQELEYVNHNVRSKLDELKRQELERLKTLATRKFELSNDIDRMHMKIPEHLDHENEHTFEIDDLKRLILKTSEDLAEADRRRRSDFKEYELQKEFEKQEKLRMLDEQNRKKYEEELRKQQEKHNKHEKIHHPGNKAQLEEVWEKQDHMEGQDFDPKTFFMLHDLDGNQYWDENEVKVLFIKELDKIYQAGAPEDDMKERAEEMERMREHVFKEADTNHDGLISYQEFLDQTKRDEFRKDPGWDTVDHQPQFSHEEYLEFERRRQEEIQRLIAAGKLPPHPNMPQGYYPDHNGQYQMHPNEIPGQYHPQAQGHPNQAPQYPQVPQYQQHPQQQQQIPQYQQHPQQPPQYHQQQQPPPQYQQPQHAPQYQQQVNYHPNQVYENHPNNVQQSGQQSNQYQQPLPKQPLPQQPLPQQPLPQQPQQPQLQQPNQHQNQPSLAAQNPASAVPIQNNAAPPPVQSSPQAQQQPQPQPQQQVPKQAPQPAQETLQPQVQTKHR